MSALWALLAALAGKLLDAFFGARQAATDKQDSDNAHERAAVAESASETQQAIAEVADERSRIPAAPSDVGALARSLRARKAAAHPDSDHQSPQRGF